MNDCRKICFWGGLAIAVAFLVVWLAGFVMFVQNIERTEAQTHSAPVDAIIVLTGGAGRIGHGIDLLIAGKGRELFISGVNEQVDMPTIMAVRPDVDVTRITCCLTIGHAAHNTRQNARESRKWIAGVHDINSVRLVTSGYHMPRALLEFRHALPGIDIVPEPVAYGAGPDHDRQNFWTLVFAEYNKSLLTALRLALTPAPDRL